MDAGTVFLIIFIILILGGIITVIILAALGIFGVKTEEKLLNGNFFIRPVSKLSDLVVNIGPVGSTGAIILSNDKTISCSNYTWSYTNSNLTTGSTTNPGVLAAVSATDNSFVKINSSASSSGTLDQWIYYELEQTWCLKSNQNLCLYDNNGTIILKNKSLNPRFSFIIEKTNTTNCA